MNALCITGVKMTKFEEMVTALNNNPSKANWEKFAKELKKSNIKYYRTVYINGKIKKIQDLKKSYAILYDAKYKIVTKVPVYKNVSKGEIEGALAYLMGLLNANKVD